MFRCWVLTFPFVGTILCLTVAQTVHAQSEFKVKGIVRNAETGAVVPGVNVVIKGSTIGTTTDMGGEYSLTLPQAENKRDSLTFSYIGNVSRTVPINGMNKVNVNLQILSHAAPVKKEQK